MCVRGDVGDLEALDGWGAVGTWCGVWCEVWRGVRRLGGEEARKVVEVVHGCEDAVMR